MNSEFSLAPKPRQLAVKFPAIKHIANLLTIDDNYNAEAFLIKKEIRDRDLLIKFRVKGKIIT